MSSTWSRLKQRTFGKKTVDEDYEVQKARVFALAKDVEILNSKVQTWIHCYGALIAAEKDLSSSFASYFEQPPTDAWREGTMTYDEHVTQIEENEFKSKVEAPVSEGVIQELAKWSSQFEQVKMACKEWDNRRQVFDYYNKKVGGLAKNKEKKEESNKPVAEKEFQKLYRNEEKHYVAQESFTKFDANLKKKLEAVFDERFKLFVPTVQLLVAQQAAFLEGASQHVGVYKDCVRQLSVDMEGMTPADGAVTMSMDWVNDLDTPVDRANAEHLRRGSAAPWVNGGRQQGAGSQYGAGAAPPPAGSDDGVQGAGAGGAPAAVNPYDKPPPAQAVNPYEKPQEEKRAAPAPPPAAAAAAAPEPERATVRARALYPFDSTDESELGLLEGDDILLFSAEDNDGWYEAEKDGRTGLVPSSYVEILK